MSGYNKAYYQQYEAGFVSENRSDHQRIIELCQFIPENKVLEIGCGYGVLLKKIKSKIKFGIETNQYAVDQCKKEGLEVIFSTDSEKNLRFADNYFDFVIMNEVIEHLRSPEAILPEIYRVLRPGGKLVITTTAKNLLNQNIDPTHLSEMGVACLKQLLESNQFKVIVQEVSGIHLINFILNNSVFKIGRFIRNKFGNSSKNIVGAIQDKYNKTFLGKLLSKFRPNFLSFGTTQLVIAKKI